MIFPFESLSAESRELGLVAGTALGFLFGFVLERSGFGRAQKLVGQFYGNDMTVLKVMFGAIVTAMVGLAILSGAGLVDLAAIGAGYPTYLWPMIVGGLMLGVGFIVSGYCPGTSFVATASGKLDGLATVVGVVVGQVAYAELQSLPWLARFHASGEMGPFFLPELLRIPAPVVALFVAAMAIGAFLGAEKIEALVNGRDVGAANRPLRKLVFAGWGSLAVVGVATLALPTGTVATSRAAVAISPLDLARRVLDEPWKVRVVDLRAMEACAKQRVPGAECVPAEQLASLGLADQPPARDVVLVADGDLAEVPAAAAGFPGTLLALDDGMQGWQAFALTAPEPPGPSATEPERDLYRLRAGIHSAMTGAKAAPPAPPPVGTMAAPKKKGAGGGCGG